MSRGMTLAVIGFAFLAASALADEEPVTSDFEFLLGSWDLEAIQSPGTDRETIDVGVRTCAYVLDGAYLRCDTHVERSNGSQRHVVSLHNYNSVAGHHESLYYFSNWPVKPMARSTIERTDDGVRWLNEFEFPIDGDRVEFIRSEFTVTGDTIENVEHLRTSDDPVDAWRLNYREKLVRREAGPPPESGLDSARGENEMRAPTDTTRIGSG